LLDGKPFSVHREGDRVILRQAGQDRQEIDLVPPAAEPSVEPAPQEPFSSPENGVAQEALPRPLCPDGSPQTAWQPPDAELPPGVSGLDEPMPGEQPGMREEGGAL